MVAGGGELGCVPLGIPGPLVAGVETAPDPCKVTGVRGLISTRNNKSSHLGSIGLVIGGVLVAAVLKPGL